MQPRLQIFSRNVPVAALSLYKGGSAGYWCFTPAASMSLQIVAILNTWVLSEIFATIVCQSQARLLQFKGLIGTILFPDNKHDTMIHTHTKMIKRDSPHCTCHQMNFRNSLIIIVMSLIYVCFVSRCWS